MLAMMEVEDNILRIVGDPKGILDSQLRPYPLIKNFYLYKLVKIVKNWSTILSVGRHDPNLLCLLI
jgi:hypothetical protein